MSEFISKINILPLEPSWEASARRRWDTRIKPPGSLGLLEHAVERICAVQASLTPDISDASAILFAADHHIIEEGVSNSLQEVTWQQSVNFSQGRGAFGLLSGLYGFTSLVVDIGVNHDFSQESPIRNAKVAYGARNFLNQPAMTREETLLAIGQGMESVDAVHPGYGGLIVFAEMGVGNTTSAAALTAHILNVSPSLTTGRGAGLNDKQLERKRTVVFEALDLYRSVTDPLTLLGAMGGLEIAAMTGAMLRAAEKRMVILLDGYVSSTALLVASLLHPGVLEYVLAGHVGAERGHSLILDHFSLAPLLSLGLYLGEGGGALLSYPLLSSAVQLFNCLDSFVEGEVNDSANRILRKGAFE